MSRRLILPLAVLAVLAVPAFASFAPTHGHYTGHAPHHGNYSVAFTLAAGRVESWVMDNRLQMPTAVVNPRTHMFKVAKGAHTLSGHWTSATTVVGVYETRRTTPRGPVTVTIEWIAHLPAG